VPTEAPPPALARAEFDRARAELIGEVEATPERRADALISRLAQHAARLEVHARLLDAAVAEARSARWRVAGGVALAALVAIALAAFIAMTAQTLPPAILGGVIALLVTSGAVLVARRLLATAVSALPARLPLLFERLYGRELLLREHADDLRARFAEVRDRTARALAAVGALRLPRLRRREQRALDRVLREEVPALRRGLAEPGESTRREPGEAP
ncbi:MAG: hypothetical protein KC620_17995, partial [Myxococcales bacterium]|nr:hypothetical protein [Myxococcales bacterium]